MVQSLAPDRATRQEDCNYPIHVFMVRQTVVRKDQGKVVHEEILGTGELTTSDMCGWVWWACMHKKVCVHLCGET